MKINNNLNSIVEPIFLSATFSQKKPSQWGYGRVDNPTRLSLEKELAILEKAKHGLAFSSGSAAVAALFLIFKSGDHILCHEELYEGTMRQLEKVFKKFGLVFDLVNFSDLKKVQQSINKKTKLLFFENITNPTLKVINVKEIAGIAKKNKIKVAVDNTICTPIFQKPLCLGADIVIHSLTKFINGHHDVIAGAIMLNNEKIFKQLKFFQHTIGAVPSPFDCFLMGRGIKTLSLRMKRYKESAEQVSWFLNKHKQVKKISFPGVSGLVSFWLKGDNIETKRFLGRLKHIKIAHSFGGVESTILHPSSMMTFSFSEKKMKELGIANSLLRLSVGLEEIDLIIKDLDQALN